MKQSLFCIAVLALLSSLGSAAPAKKPVPEAIPARIAALPKDAPATTLKSGVNINATTRNEKASPATLQLARGGKALLPIVISDKASAGTKAVAADLKKYLDQMSGANFEIKTGDGTSGIVLGNKDEFPVPALDKALAIVNGFDGREAYAIRTRENKLLLLGATDQGTSHAAYRLLEEMGCRWFFPAKEWEVIPTTADLKFAKEITDRPNFLSRDIWAAWGLHGGAGPDGRTAGGDSSLWSRRNHMGASFNAAVSHANIYIITANMKEFDAHPEYYALIGGKRQGPQFDYSNPGLRKLIADYAVKYFTANPTATLLGIGPADGGGWSTGAESDAYGTPGDSVFKMANEVAKAVEKAFPGQNKLLGIYAYNWHSDPPPFPLEPNIYIQLTTAFLSGKMGFDQLMEEWPKKAKNLGFRDYYSVWLWDADRWPGGRIAHKDYAVNMIRGFENANIRSGAVATSISAESGFNWGPNGRGYYLASRLMWNPQRDADAILDDFYKKAFGKGAAAMQKYYEQVEKLRFMSLGVIGNLFRSVNEASEKTKDDAAVQARLDHIKQYLNFEFLKRIDAPAEQVNAHVYRTRWSYMTHWYAMNLHGYAINPAKAKELKLEEPMTHAETEAMFQDGVKTFPELRMPVEVKFSTDLVPVKFGAGPALWYSTFQEGSQYIFYSSGAPIKVKIEAGGSHGFNRHLYQITDARGKVLKEGRPQIGDKVSIEFPVPAPGLYNFSYSDGGAHGTVIIPQDQIVVLPITARPFRAMSPVPDLYFYVPKGTKEISYYYKRADWQYGGPHRFADSTGKIVKEVNNVDGDYVSFPVPAGQDGKMWAIGGPGFGLGSFTFFNIPNYFSTSADTTLLPREVVAKDGLKIFK